MAMDKDTVKLFDLQNETLAAINESMQSGLAVMNGLIRKCAEFEARIDVLEETVRAIDVPAVSPGKGDGR